MSNKMAACEAECGQVISDNIEIQEKLEVQVRAEETEGGRQMLAPPQTARRRHMLPASAEQAEGATTAAEIERQLREELPRV